MPSSSDLRRLLLTPQEAAELDAPGNKDAAVLVPLYTAGGELYAVFTQRRDDMRRHAGEISFPGGRQDEPDEDLRETALREADEEIGLPPEVVEMVGALPPVSTFVSGYRVHPFVGAIPARRSWRPQETEVARVLEVSLGDLIRGYESRRLLRRGVPVKTPTYTVRSRGGLEGVAPHTHFVWGATARIVESLLERLGPLL